MKREKRINSKTFYVLVLIILLAAFLISAYNIFVVLFNGNRINNYIYTNKGDVSYEVYLIENDATDKIKIQEGKSYVLPLTEKISMTLEYTYDSEDFINITEKHLLKIILYRECIEGEYEVDDLVILEDEYVIKNEKTSVLTKENNKVIENIDIDLNKYSDDIKEFIELYSIPVKAYIEIVMPVEINGYTDEYIIKDTYEVLSRINVNEDVYKVVVDKDNVAERIVNSKNNIEVDYSNIDLYIYVCCIAGILIVLCIIKVRVTKTKDNYYMYLRRIKKDNAEKIIETKNMINSRDLKPIVITTFNEMLNLSNNLNLPIILYEKENIACFYIVKDKIIYTFLIKNKVRG